MKINDQVKMSTPQPVMASTLQAFLRRAGIAAAATALGVGTVSAQMAPTQPAPAPAPVAPVAQAAGSPNEAAFKRVDADGDGYISKAELEKADANLGKDFAKYDLDKDGRLSMTEFDAMMKSMKG